LKYQTQPALAACLLLVLAAGCGGSLSGSPGAQQPPSTPSVSSITVTCDPGTITSGGTSQCSASVQGTGSYSSSVTWIASTGTITSAGLFTALTSSGTVTVTATSTEDTSKSGSAAITVEQTPSTITSVAVTCSPTAVNAGGTSQCGATVQGTGSFSSSVTWSASAGTIDAAGLFTAPASAASVTVTATSTEDTTKTGEATVTVQLGTPPSKHVVIVMEENQSYSTVVGNSAVWPNLNDLIGKGALATNYYADSHPSIGNYFMLTTGQLLTTNDSSTKVWDVDNIARHMLAAGVSFKVYAEGVTQGYVGGNTGIYLIRHNPFAMLSDVASNPQVANETIWPFTQFAADLANGALPEFSFVVPDVDDDAHNGTPQQADTWLEANIVSPLSGDSAFEAGGDGLLIVDFDEALDSDTTHGGGHVSPVFWGPNVKAGYQQTSATVYQHESMLRTIMEALQLPSPPGAAAAAPSMDEFFMQP
jgi:acid phosphatase